MVRSNVDTFRHYIAEINRGNAAVIDEIFAPDFVQHSLWHEPYTPTRERGKEEAETARLRAEDHERDLTVTIDHVVEAGDTLTAATTTTGTMGKRTVTATRIDILRFESGRVVERWSSWDRLGYFQQLGAVPATAELLERVGEPL
jgi:ketosteroid isomerase-like protein